MTEIKTRLQKIRYEALTEISGILARHDAEDPDFTFGGSTPIVLADEFFRQNKDEGWRENIITGERQKI